MKPQNRQRPLAYMLRVMNNPNVPDDRRDRMAIAAAPYCHPRVIEHYRGKKAKQLEAAKKATTNGPVWSTDLAFPEARN